MDEKPLSGSPLHRRDPGPALPQGGPLEGPIPYLRRMYPHGHPGFTDLSLEEIALHSRKNKDYSQGGPTLGNFHRVSAIARLYPGMDWDSPFGVAIMYSLKQLDAVLNSRARRQALNIESAAERLRDDSVYKKLAILLLTEEDIAGSEGAVEVGG